ncbi:protein of unknown function [Candidatus Methylomirabilis oxygeniifera]|uniref:Uncharacterized protein n=1 Tax=Methylomirabilis oxygeniifera TaxID=671143 RepID=D5MM24_METO1|nr:protein of unknown function [Candidatus Methylomirabilis oxyfera]
MSNHGALAELDAVIDKHLRF